MQKAGLTTAQMDSMAKTALGLGGRVEWVTYAHKATPTATPTVHCFQVKFTQYQQHQIDMQLILQNDERCLIRTAAVPFVPDRHDLLTRADGTQWHVIAASEGVGMPFYVLHTRQVARKP